MLSQGSNQIQTHDAPGRFAQFVLEATVIPKNGNAWSFGHDQHKVDLCRIPSLGDLALQAKCQHLFAASVA
jgi:hypothetical protein